MTVKYLTIHCSATRENQNFSAKQIKLVGYERFGQPSYHLVIERDGSYERHLSDDTIGAHVAKKNTGNIGICYIGGLDANGKPTDTRTLAQKKTMRALIRTMISRYPNIIIRGHRDWSPDLNRDGIIERSEWIKDCPCFSVSEWMAAGFPD